MGSVGFARVHSCAHRGRRVNAGMLGITPAGIVVRVSGRSGRRVRSGSRGFTRARIGVALFYCDRVCSLRLA